jgi:hypothetical protein
MPSHGTIHLQLEDVIVVVESVAETDEFRAGANWGMDKLISMYRTDAWTISFKLATTATALRGKHRIVD